VLGLVESSFGQIKSKAITNNNYFEPEIASSRSVELVSELPRDRVVRNWLTPQLGHSDRAALDVLAAMLQRDEIASGVVVNVEIGQRLEQDIFSMGWSVGGNDPQLVSKQVWRMLTDYKLAEVNESVLSEVKAQLADTYSSLPMRSRPYFALAGTLAWHAAHDKVDALVGYYDAVMAVSADDLARVTKFYLAKSKCVTVTFKGTGEEVKPLPSGYQELQAAAAAANEVGDFARAIEAYTRILKIKKDPMSQIINLTERGVIHLELKNYDAAIADFEAGLTYYDYPAVADMLRDAIAQKKRAMRGRVR
jgi:tetratricopeptide (TPR) repeat protein